MRSQKNGRNEDTGRGLEGWGGWEGNSLMFIEHLWTQPHFIPPVNLTAASWEENRLYCCTDEELDCWKSELLTKGSDSVSNTAISGWQRGWGGWCVMVVQKQPSLHVQQGGREHLTEHQPLGSTSRINTGPDQT